MSDAIDLQLVWHFHQPYYSVPGASSNTLPWVRLHAIRSYYDMGRMLERFPDIRCVINFSGSLLAQIREYVEDGKRDNWWELTQKRAVELEETDKAYLLRHFFSLDRETSIEPLPRYRELLEQRGEETGEFRIESFSTQDFRDLQVLFNLAWFGFSARRERAVVEALLEKGRGFTESEKQALLEQQIEVMQLLIPMYRRLHREGQIELTVSPMYHPIVPLLADSDVARQSTEAESMPPRLEAPEDAGYQIAAARQLCRDFLGIDVDGMWPPEGGVSEEAVALFADHDTRWIASGEEVLQASLEDWQRARDLYRPWQLPDFPSTRLYFRDSDLSDRISFNYADMNPEDAVDDFIEGVRSGAESASSAGLERPAVTVIADGENPWEDYEEDGEPFLEAFYQRLTTVEDIETVTPSKSADDAADTAILDSLHPGSWIHGDFSIWIGNPQTNRAWTLLGQARDVLLDRERAARADDKVDVETAWEALYMAEGSDWFWWYGDDFSSQNDPDFDRLFRDQLRAVYSCLSIEPPAELDIPISQDATRQSSFQPPHSLVEPTIDGKSDYFYEWSGAGVYINRGATGSSFDNKRYVDELRIGFDLENLYLRLDPARDFKRSFDELEIRIRIQKNDETDETFDVIEVTLGEAVGASVLDEEGQMRDIIEFVGYQDSVELAVPFESLALEAGQNFSMTVGIWSDDRQLEQHPPDRSLELTVPDETFEARNWMV